MPAIARRTEPAAASGVAGDMRFIPTRIHGVLDYLYSALLLLAPWLFGFADWGALHWIAMLAGAGTLVVSLLTDYELGLRHVVSVPTHLALDVASGLLLAWLAYIIGEPHGAWLIVAGFGLFSAFAGAFTLSARGNAPAHVLRV